MERKCIGIIGASGVIGSAVAKALDSEGFRLGLHYCSNEGAIDELLKSSDRPSDHYVCQSSLANLDSGAQIIDAFRAHFGELHGLALCAGRVPWKNETQLNVDDWADSTFELAAQPFNMALHFSNICPPESRIVALSSISAKYGGSSNSRHYGAAKAALESSLIGLSHSLAFRKICVNVVRAGFVVTPQQTSGRTPEQIEERVEKIPFGRPGRPEEIAGLFSFLFGETASFITGQCISISGGD
jgi:3-oxoacyl-[acyl-carrier protein] reductase